MTALIIAVLSTIGILSLGEIVSKSNKRAGYENDFSHMQWHLRSPLTTQDRYQSVR